MNTKIRLLQLKKKQVDLLGELFKRGFSSMDPSTLSKIINHQLNTPQAHHIREEISEILTEWEKEE